MRLPNPPIIYDQRDQAETRDQLRKADQDNLKSGRDLVFSNNIRVILTSPGGSQFYLAVSDLGVLTAEAV